MTNNSYICSTIISLISRIGVMNFDDYIRQGEPDKREKAGYWRTAIGLQAVDGLKPSEYLMETARKHIEGEIDIDEARALIKTYYQSKRSRRPDDDQMQEADKVSANITKILSSVSLDFSSQGIVALHRRIFDGVFKQAGKLRDYDITKREWVLDDDTVRYLNWEDLRRALDYDIEQERRFSYKGLSTDDLITHITKFVSGIWQIHAFCEGNTRTTAVFAILYLRDLGFQVNNDMFADHSWYFRNALVRANYRNAVKGIDYTPVYLERFFRNLLLGEQWDLRNRYLHICPSRQWRVQPNFNDRSNRVEDDGMYPTSTPQVPHKLPICNANVVRLALAVSQQTLSVSDMMALLQLKDRKSFLNTYLSPAIKAGFVKMLYPESPHHPRQKYLLTAKGLTLAQRAAE